MPRPRSVNTSPVRRVSMDERRELGNLGEQLTADYLVERGYKILERQWKCEYGEIDLICLDSGGEVVFVEVKTRESLESGYPEESVTETKRHHLQACGEWFLHLSAWEKREHRYDVVAIILRDGEAPEITHLIGI